VRRALDCHFNEGHGANMRGVVPERELFHIAVQMLGAHVVIDADVAAQLESDLQEERGGRS